MGGGSEWQIFTLQLLTPLRRSSFPKNSTGRNDLQFDKPFGFLQHHPCGPGKRRTDPKSCLLLSVYTQICPGNSSPHPKLLFLSAQGLSGHLDQGLEAGDLMTDNKCHGAPWKMDVDRCGRGWQWAGTGGGLIALIKHTAIPDLEFFSSLQLVGCLSACGWYLPFLHGLKDWISGLPGNLSLSSMAKGCVSSSTSSRWIDQQKESIGHW